MGGLIEHDDVAKVRDLARIDDIVGEFITLRRAGVGALKGLCPFHDEKTPSFTVRPAVGLWHCFGCGEGGDVIAFVQQAEHLGFREAVEWLADKVGVELSYTEGGPDAEAPSVRRRIMEAHKIVADFYSEQLLGPDARAARDFLRAKKFDRAAAEHFGVGYAPQSWDAVCSLLESKGFTREEIITAGLASTNEKGRSYDRFRGRVTWPICDVTGAVIGFGARKLYDDDKGPKYLNTPETPVYSKGGVLYGLSLAKKSIAKDARIVVVEGYTDVMACHLAGVTHAVATCGTAFGSDHARLVRRMLMSDDVLTGEIIFTFDGDAAGQKAALRAYDLDEQFLARTMVAVGPAGLDPCDVRVQRGNEAVTKIIDKREPLYHMVVTARLEKWDLSTIEGRVQGLRDVAPVLADIKGEGTRNGYIRQVAAWLVTPENEVAAAVAGAATQQANAAARTAARQVPEAPSQGRPQHIQQRGFANTTNTTPVRGSTLEIAIRRERELLKLLVQHPEVAAYEQMAEVDEDVFALENHRLMFASLEAAGLREPAAAGAGWIEKIMKVVPPQLAKGVSWLAMSEIPIGPREADLQRYAVEIISRVALASYQRRKLDLRAEAARARGEELDAINEEVKLLDEMIHALVIE